MRVCEDTLQDVVDMYLKMRICQTNRQLLQCINRKACAKQKKQDPVPDDAGPKPNIQLKSELARPQPVPSPEPVQVAEAIPVPVAQAIPAPVGAAQPQYAPLPYAIPAPLHQPAIVPGGAQPQYAPMPAATGQFLQVQGIIPGAPVGVQGVPQPGVPAAVGPAPLPIQFGYRHGDKVPTWTPPDINNWVTPAQTVQADGYTYSFAWMSPAQAHNQTGRWNYQSRRQTHNQPRFDPALHHTIPEYTKKP